MFADNIIELELSNTGEVIVSGVKEMSMLPYYPIIRVIATAYEIPQLGRKRRIAALLPHNYYETTKQYPVIYLNDGQNLFNDDAPYGNWKVDTSLQKLAEKGKGEVIIIAIDHGGKERIVEYSPYPNDKFGEAQGDLYLDFLINTLKPYVERTFRVSSKRENTGIGGSSMGGLISLYAGMKYSNVFGKLLVFSPSLWIAPQMFEDTSKVKLAGFTKLYLYAGEKESKSHIPDLMRYYITIRRNKELIKDLDMEVSINPDGVHSEYCWEKEFPIALEWLFDNV